jgi:hypothetical protein
VLPMRRSPAALLVVTAACGAALGLAAPAAAVLELRFATPPALPSLPAVTLNARPQTTQAAMTSFAVEDTRLSKSGWNVTAQGETGAGKSAVFAEYCPKAKCGTNAEGFVAGGQSLPADSLTLNSGGASFTGGLGTAPTLQCATPCDIDNASAVKIASGGSGVTASEGTWTAGGFSGSSLELTTATTLRALPNEEVYRVNILWTLSSGP